MSSTQTSSRSHHARVARTKATGTLEDLSEGADFAKRVFDMFETVVELMNKILIFPTKLSTQKLELEAEQQRTAASFLKSQDTIRTALNNPNLTQEELEEVSRVAEEERRKEWPKKTKANEDMFKFDAWIHNSPERCRVKGLLDTGADDSWISTEALKCAKLTTDVKRTTKPQLVMSFDGAPVQVLGEITIQWYFDDAAAIRQTQFLVFENSAGDGVDMILGKEDIVKYEFVNLRRVTRALKRYNKPEEIKRAAENAKKNANVNELLAKQQREQEIEELERKLEKLRTGNNRAGNNRAGPSLSASSVETSEPQRRPPPPPIPAKSANAIAQYEERERTRSLPVVTVDASEDTSPSPSLRPPEAHSRSSSMGSLSMLSSRSNLTAISSSTPRTSQSSENPFMDFIARLKSKSDDDKDQEQQTGPSDRGPRSRLSPSRWWPKRKSDKSFDPYI